MKLKFGWFSMLVLALSLKASHTRAEDAGNAAGGNAAGDSAAAVDTKAPPAAVVAPVTAPGAAATTDGDYEIDYEEEPESEGDDAETVAPVKPAKGKKTTYAPGGGAGGIQGSRAKHRFTPILKSETKSIYKKDGKALDVDSD